MTPQTTLHVIAALFGAYMLVRNLPGALSVVRGQGGSRPMAMVAVVNVLLAVVILGYAVKGLVSPLLSP